MKKFDIQFSEVVRFYPDGYYLSKNIFTKEEALALFREELECEDIQIDEIKEDFARFQPTPQDLVDEGLSKMAWITCKSTDRNAQPCWVYGL